ncbi:MAG: helix-turn-helix domain-containing protein [Treponema sp.]
MEFYERVKRLVKTNTHYTLAAFIKELGINYETYKGQSRYNNLPRADEAYKIAQALNTTVEYLVTGQEPDSARRELEELKAAVKKLVE